MGLFDKAKKLTDRAMDTVKDIDNGVNNQVQKRNEQKQIKKETYNPYIFISNNTKIIKNEMAKRGFKPISITEIAEFSDEDPLSESFQYNNI